MLKILTLADTQKINDSFLRQYTYRLTKQILYEYRDYCSGSLEDVGAIFILERSSDLGLFPEMGLSSPLIESRFEWVEYIGNRYCNGCIVITNDTTINIIAKKSIFKQIGVTEYENS